MTTAVSELLAWATGGSAPTTLLKFLAAVGALVFWHIHRRYLGVLGANRRMPAERQAYDALRNSVALGNMATRLYAERLTRFLDWIDGFFGDADMAARTLFPHAFGLRTPAPLWTAPAFHRCLLLAFFYPIVTIYMIWAISGHIGPAEAALHLPRGLPGWGRGLVVAASALLITAYARFISTTGWQSLAWSAVGTAICVAGGAAAAAAGAAAALAAVLAVVCAAAGAVTGAVTGAALIVVAVTGAVVVASGAGFGAGAGFVAGFAAGGVVIWANAKAASRGWQGVFLWFLVVTMIIACLAAAKLLSSLSNWEISGPLLLFLGLLTLLNAPFDWASLGLTRALLRRGLELGGWWPYALATVDAGLAAVIIAALALTMIVGVQAFDTLAVHGAGTPVLPLEPLFDGIAAHPTAPEYWWLYALLLSTMIPSLANLVIGGTSLVRGLPGLPALLLRYIPERGGVLKWDRHWIATVLTAQVAAGAALGIAAQAFLVVVIIGYVVPLFGADLLGMARDVAAFNLPARVGQLFGVNL